ncbi:MAG: type II toxin-antitoxin system PemK/MazF family toxin [Clostridiaceae bacterium]|nr:type II toxin-antitoxin system PemK/MazF family toxin [Clostridiaceae bacterium]
MNGIKRGEIYYAESSPVIGSEQGGNRHTIILQNDKGNLHSRTTIIAAITSELDKARMPTHVIFTVNGMKKKSMVLLEQIRTIDKSRLGNYVGSVDNKTMKQIDHAIAVSFGLKYWEELKNG